jgi:hypothetical protein
MVLVPIRGREEGGGFLKDDLSNRFLLLKVKITAVPL